MGRTDDAFGRKNYELEDGFETNLVNALLLIHQLNTENKLDIKPLTNAPKDIPIVLKAIQDSYTSSDLYSKQSFTILYPLVKSMLIGISSPFTNCEDSALKILGDHVSVVISENEDEEDAKYWRRDYSLMLLEFLLHDRCSQSYHTTTIDILMNVYHMNTNITPGEMAPLLNDIGLLSSNTKNLIASLQAIHQIISTSSSNLTNDTLVENRVWIHCFSSNKDVRTQARIVWKSLRSNTPSNLKLESPSKLYAFPLYPLLSHEQTQIAQSAANAFSYGMCVHVDTMEQNVLKLCKLYIDSFPVTSTTTSDSTVQLLPQSVKKSTITSKKKASISSLKPKSSTTKKPKKTTNLLAVGTKTTSNSKKKSSSKKISASLLLPKKEERTIDEENMLSFSSIQKSTAAKKVSLLDSNTKK